ncbi:MAG: hypothetical protein A2070_08740 [Bdellovibrionales bacterium GWC1_52_8]|nr:MAG: hypothetical protein A2Z97_12235 [Bdellovibrionales bacterium GWB1_52_6]OFZ03710.1 MAG: hypothetical protein A2X97_14215 [Bdellovibrionales bacterium GWA1_52_35]OFZ41140.1 MAG: hypothetical protein A2070_08740 [Bdellovibrionales bacterium GWC1_52_8]HCM38778.1 hypothetical protein [Bdellovibrionales bacterium]
MSFKNLLLLTLCASVLPATGFAKELKELYRGARAQALGNAYVAVSDDDEAIFYNPAGLAGQKKYSINYMALNLEGSTDIMSMFSEGSALRNMSGDSLNIMMGKNIFGHAQFAPSLTMSNFGAAILVDEQLSVRAENKAMPQVVLGYQQTNGFQVGWGTALGGGRRASNGEFRVGLGAKLMWRRGGYRLLDLAQLISVSRNTLHEIAGNYKQGYGFDMGLQYVRKVNSRLELRWGGAWTDIGSTDFGDGPDPQPSTMTTGVAAVYRFANFSGTFSYDLRHLNEPVDWKMKNHVGVELGMPMIRVYAGYNQAFLTYGLGFDAWLMKVMAVHYTEEQGSYATMDPERRYLLQIALKVGI